MEPKKPPLPEKFNLHVPQMSDTDEIFQRMMIETKKWDDEGLVCLKDDPNDPIFYCKLSKNSKVGTVQMASCFPLIMYYDDRSVRSGKKGAFIHMMIDGKDDGIWKVRLGRIYQAIVRGLTEAQRPPLICCLYSRLNKKDFEKFEYIYDTAKGDYDEYQKDVFSKEMVVVDGQQTYNMLLTREWLRSQQHGSFASIDIKTSPNTQSEASACKITVTDLEAKWSNDKYLPSD